MKSRFTAAVTAAAVAAATVALAVAAPPRALAGAVRNHNDDSLIRIQQRGGDPSAAGRVGIEYYGHDAFKLTSPEGVTVLLDPWQNDPTGQFAPWFSHPFPRIPVDMVLSTHDHFDHNAVQRPDALMVFERLIGSYQLGDVAVQGLADKHQCHSQGKVDWDEIGPKFHIELCPPNNVLPFDNTIQILHVGGMRIADWGDNRPVPAPGLDRDLHNLDVLILPIDGSQHILTYREVSDIIDRYHPRIVIPGHYADRGLTLKASTLESANGWVSTQRDVTRTRGDSTTIDPHSVRRGSTRILYFGDHYARR